MCLPFVPIGRRESPSATALLAPLTQEGQLFINEISPCGSVVLSPSPCAAPVGHSFGVLKHPSSQATLPRVAPLSKEGEFFISCNSLRRWLSIMYSAARCSCMSPVYTALSSAKRACNFAGLLGMSSIMCGVSHSSFIPNVSYVASMRSDSSMVSTPSSTPGSMWEWWSTAPCRMPLAAIVVFLLKGHTA